MQDGMITTGRDLKKHARAKRLTAAFVYPIEFFSFPSHQARNRILSLFIFLQESMELSQFTRRANREDCTVAEKPAPNGFAAVQSRSIELTIASLNQASLRKSSFFAQL